MKKTLLFALALVSICAISCKKDTKPADKIIFGNTEGMNVVNYDTILYMVGTLSMDLDQDGTDDLRLESSE